MRIKIILLLLLISLTLSFGTSLIPNGETNQCFHRCAGGEIHYQLKGWPIPFVATPISGWESQELSIDELKSDRYKLLTPFDTLKRFGLNWLILFLTPSAIYLFFSTKNTTKNDSENTDLKSVIKKVTIIIFGLIAIALFTSFG